MDFILVSRRLKFYTKEIIKVLNIAIIGMAIILALILIKYKPAYEVKIAEKEIGFIANKTNFENMIENYIKNYNSKNVESVSITNNPEYKLKLIDKKQETSENEILIAMQKEMIIKYHYYEIYINNQKVESVDTLEEAQTITNKIEEVDKNIKYKIKEIKTKKVEPNINGIKLAVLPVQGNITSRYGVSSRIRVSTHTGLDIAAVTGTAIKAVAAGIVTNAAYTGSYGNLVKIDHGNGVETWYGHTSKMYVKVGQNIQAGDTIAAVGSTGNSTGPHLHFEIRINGQHINPQNYIYNN